MVSAPLRIVFAGTPDFAAKHLDALHRAGLAVVGAYTQPDRPAGRGKKLLPSPVKQLAASAGIPVFQPASLKGEVAQQQLAELNADVMVVVAYGLILPQAVLDIPRHCCINVHASLLPRWRGAAPIQRAIEAGDQDTGVTIMRMDSGLDTGDMLTSMSCPIGPETTAATLHDELAAEGAPLLIEVLQKLPDYLARAVSQEGSGATYARKILKAEAEIDWGRDAIELARAVRAFNPFPGCFTHLGDDRVKIWQASAVATTQESEPGTIIVADREGIRVCCGTGELCITQLQLPGGQKLGVQQVLNARSELFAPGSRLGAT